MKKVVVLFLALTSCDIRPPDHEIRFDLSKEELEAPPSYHRWKGAILMDIRVWRELDKKPENGERTCPLLSYDDAGVPICSNDEEPLLIFDLTKDISERPNRVRELAYFCREEHIYYYHYIGGAYHLDTWQGPFQINRKRPKLDLGGDEK